MTTMEGMRNQHIETIARFVKWKAEICSSDGLIQSPVFKIGPWHWHISCEYFYSDEFEIKFFEALKKQSLSGRCLLSVHSDSSKNIVKETLPLLDGFFTWKFSCPERTLVIEVECIDLQINPPEEEKSNSLWASEGMMQRISNQCLSRLLNDSIDTDVTIKAKGKLLKAHRVILVGSSPVFRRMFEHDFREKETSEIVFDDLSEELCDAFINCLYGTIKYDEFYNHRFELLEVANKYDIVELKEACEDSLRDDLNVENVLHCLRVAWTYKMKKLKDDCWTYLIDFGRINEVRDQIDELFDNCVP